MQFLIYSTLIVNANFRNDSKIKLWNLSHIFYRVFCVRSSKHVRECPIILHITLKKSFSIDSASLPTIVSCCTVSQMRNCRLSIGYSLHCRWLVRSSWLHGANIVNSYVHLLLQRICSYMAAGNVNTIYPNIISYYYS